jgi:hypothetical protein
VTGSSLWWGEAWGFDFAVKNAEPGDVLGGFVRIAVYPRQQRVWFWAGIVGEGRKYVLCRDHDLAPPADLNVLEVRGGSLWSHAICETPLEHWTVAMEAYAVEFEDPYDAWRDERGDRIGLAFDLEWESDADLARWVGSTEDVSRYETPCEVNGTLQVGDEEWTIVGEGWRHHEWGVLDWTGPYARIARQNECGVRPRTKRTEAHGSNDETGAVDDDSDLLARAPGSPQTRKSVAIAPVQIDRTDGPSIYVLRTLDRLSNSGQLTTGWAESTKQ